MPLFEKTERPLKRVAEPERNVRIAIGTSQFVETFEMLAEASGGTTGLRRLVLDLAVRGLLASQEPDDVAAEATGEAAETRERPFDVPSTWAWTTVDAVCRDSFYGPRFGKGDYVEDGGVPTIRTTDMADSG